MGEWIKPLGYESCSILHIVSGLLIAILPLFYVQKKQVTTSKVWFFIALSVLIFLTIYGVINAEKSIAQLAIDIKFADMLPIIKIMNERYIEGQDIYAIIPEIHGGMYPIYLPAMWLAFLPAVLFNFDPRWITSAFILLSTVLIFFSNSRPSRNLWIGLWLLLIYFAYKLTFIVDDRIIEMTEEGVVVGYYILLCFALWKRNTLLISIAISLCLLSRYSLVFWVPVYLLFLYLNGEKRKAINISVLTGVIGLLLMLISKSITKVSYFISLQSNYKEAISNPDLEWKYGPLAQESLGIAKFFDYSNLSTLHSLLLVFALLAPVVFLIVFQFFKSKFSKVFFPLLCLKFTLVVFYNSLTMPYIYLFFTSMFVSLAIFYFYINQDTKENIVPTSA